MTYSTVNDLLTKVKNDLDLNEETFIKDAEFIGYVASAVRRAEQLILGINEDYFLTSSDVTLVSGSRDITLPSDIYAHKIRKLFYVNGTTNYEIKRIRDIMVIPVILPTDLYQYVLANSGTSGVKIKLYPQARENLTITDGLWYLRSALIPTQLTDTLDLPEAQNFILQYVKNECKKKELMGEVTQTMKDDLQEEEDQLVTTLTCMIPDENNKILIDQDYLPDQY